MNRSDRNGIVFDVVVLLCATQLAAFHVIDSTVWLMVVGPMFGARSAAYAKKRKSPAHDSDDNDTPSNGVGGAALSVGIGFIAWALNRSNRFTS